MTRRIPKSSTSQEQRKMYEVRKLPLHISHVYIIGFASVIQILVSHMSTISKRVLYDDDVFVF